MTTLQPFLFLDITKVNPDNVMDDSSEDSPNTMSQENSDNENYYYTESIELEDVEVNALQEIDDKSEGEENETSTEQNDAESEETNSAHSDPGNGDKSTDSSCRFVEEEEGNASSTETMSSEDEDIVERMESVSPANFRKEKGGYLCNICEFWDESYEALQLHFNIVHFKFGLQLNGHNSYLLSSLKGIGQDNLGNIEDTDYLFELSQQAKQSFSCPFCMYSCLFKKQMSRHIRREHWKEMDVDSPRGSLTISKDSKSPDQLDYTIEREAPDESSPIASRIRRRRRIQFDSIAKENSILAKLLADREEEGNRFTCELCQFKTSFRYSIISHFEARHGAKRVYSCDSCDYLSHSEYFLKRHFNSKHAEKKIYKCKSCDYSSARRYTMRSHIDSVHKKIKPYSCNQCSYSAARRDALKMHVTTIHEGKRPFSCSECPFSSSRKYLLKNHVRTYHGPRAEEELEKMFTCAVCGLMAKNSIALKDHLSQAHNGSTKISIENKIEDLSSYACDLCNFKCHRRTNLYSHRKAMHAGPDSSRKHPCPFCFYFAYKLTGLKGHITKCHKDCSFTDIDRVINGK